jgi:hypothetical protein
MAADSEEVRKREMTPGTMARVRTGEDPRAPWYVNMGFRFMLMVGLPTALIGWREFKDYKYEAQRLQVESERTKQMERTNSVMERVVGVLYKVEKKLPNENQ